MRLKRFQGLVPGQGFAAKVPSVPYDVVNTQEARALAEGNAHSFLHIVRPEIDLPEDTGQYSDEVYAKSVENLKRFQNEGALVRESTPSIYLYRQQMGEHIQTGVTAVCHVDDYNNDVIKKHEKTRPEKENDRTRLTSELGANTGPVFLTYKDDPAIDALVEAATAGEPVSQTTAPDGVIHTVWRVQGDEASALETAFGDVPVSYVADGHHRSASASRVGTERRKANSAHTGEEDYNWFLNVLFPGSQLKILGYNRAVHDLNGHTEEELLAAISEKFTIAPAEDKEPTGPNQVRMILGGKWYTISWPAPDASDPVGSLDVSVLQDGILAPLLGIEDPRTSTRIDFVGGIRGSEELERLTQNGRAAVAFALHPVSVEELMAIADAGEIMPPKSTWFEPKLRSGFFIHTF